jgi:hypothetical protein
MNFLVLNHWIVDIEDFFPSFKSLKFALEIREEALKNLQTKGK